jgi:hypothetical protein
VKPVPEPRQAKRIAVRGIGFGGLASLGLLFAAAPARADGASPEGLQVFA